MTENQQHSWRERILEQGLTQLGLAVMILSGRGEVLYATKAAKDLLANQNGLKIVDNHLIADLAPDNVRLQKAIATAIDPQQLQPTAVSLYVHRDLQPKPYHLSVSRMSNQEGERRENHNVLLLIKDLNLNYDHWAERLKEAFNLSPREMECVILLTERRDVHELAEVMEVSIETIRQYIKNTFKKMDVQKQHELVSLALEYRRNR
jgi:DNA-binding CsgD family transcriptional regulator